MVSLDTPVGKGTLEEALADSRVNVEEEALGHVLLSEIAKQLSPEETVVFYGKLAGKERAELAAPKTMAGYILCLRRVRSVVARSLGRDDLLESWPTKDGRGTSREFTVGERVEMKRLYLDENFSLRELGLRYECSSNTIRKILREMPEITMRPAVNPNPGKGSVWG
jgi:hypothetical protein